MTPLDQSPLDPEAAKVQAQVLKHALRDHTVRAPVPVADLLAELASIEGVEDVLVRLVDHGLMEVLPDAKIQPTHAAIRFWELSDYMT